MNCAAFDRRLDARGAEDLGAEALHHAATCARCARQWEAERKLAVLLAAPPAGSASADFTDRVLARVTGASRRAPRAAIAFTPLLADPRPFWGRVLAEPAVVGALVLAALAAFAWMPALDVATSAAHALSVWGEGASGAFARSAPAMASGPARLAPWAGLAWLLALASVPLTRWVARLAASPPRAH